MLARVGSICLFVLDLHHGPKHGAGLFKMIAVTVISCFGSFALGVGFGFIFVVERSAKKMFEDSISNG